VVCHTGDRRNPVDVTSNPRSTAMTEGLKTISYPVRDGNVIGLLQPA